MFSKLEEAGFLRNQIALDRYFKISSAAAGIRKNELRRRKSTIFWVLLLLLKATQDHSLSLRLLRLDCIMHITMTSECLHVQERISQVKTTKLGKTKLVVSRVGMGGIPIVHPPFDEAVRVLQHGFDLGINFVDTAFAYGESEERVGKAVSGNREQIVIGTKSTARDRKTAAEHIEKSLQRLGTRYVDLWQLHGINNLEEYHKALGPDGAIEAGREALKKGTIHHIGISTHIPQVALEAIVSGVFEVIQYPFNFVNNDAENDLVTMAKEHDVGFIAMKPFAGGRLKDPKLALKYLLQFDNVVPDPGVKRIEEIDEIVAIVNGSWKLTEEDRLKMEETRSGLGTKFCQYCGYCLPCPQQIDIPVLMNALSIGSYAESFVQNIARNVELARNCLQCGECERKCPFQLPIRDTIAKSIKMYDDWRRVKLG